MQTKIKVIIKEINIMDKIHQKIIFIYYLKNNFKINENYEYNYLRTKKCNNLKNKKINKIILLLID